jgi:hypothetical protein
MTQEIIESKALEEAKMKARQDGYNEAMATMQAKMDTKIADFLREYRGKMLYLKTVQAGVLEPGQVAMTYVEGQAGADGSTWVAPTFAWKVVSPPRFSEERAAVWWSNDKLNFCYFFIKGFSNNIDAVKAVGTMAKPDGVFLMSTPYADNSGRWAVIGKSVIAKCEESYKFYEDKGYDPVRVR